MTLGTKSGRIVATTVLAASTLFLTAASAMPIADYDRLSRDDRALYVSELLSRTRDYLIEHGKNIEAKKLSDAFDGADDKVYTRFFENLETGRSVARGTGRIIEVEHAMAMTLSELGIDIPKGVFLKLMNGYKPQR